MPEFRATALALAVLSAVDTGLLRDWRDDALCAQTDPEVFFPEKGGGVRAAVAVCARCPVRRDCLAYALDGADGDGWFSFGVWGGTSQQTRARLRREFGADVTAAVDSVLGPAAPGLAAA